MGKEKQVVAAHKPTRVPTTTPPTRSPEPTAGTSRQTDVGGEDGAKAADAPSIFTAVSRRRTKRPVYSPKHEYKDTDWQLMQSEVDCIDAALDGFCRKVVLQGKEGKRTTVSNEGLLCLMLEKGGRAAEMAMSIKARPGLID